MNSKKRNFPTSFSYYTSDRISFRRSTTYSNGISSLTKSISETTKLLNDCKTKFEKNESENKENISFLTKNLKELEHSAQCFQKTKAKQL